MLASLTAAKVEPVAAVPDERLLVAEAQRDPAAVARLYRLHGAAIHGYVLRRVGNSHDADDLTAEVFLSMVRALPRFRWRGVPFRAWLYRLATNEVNRWARRRRRSALRQVSQETFEQLAVAGEAGSHHDVEFLQAALLSLPPRYQSALSLYYLDEMTVAEVAQVLGRREGTVKSRLSRGRESLRALLQRKGRHHE
jgi:RNA polymerase sigma-70 factor (ECF subfamily)